MEKYRVLIKASAAKELEAIARKPDRRRIATRIAALAEAPRPHGCEKLSGRRDLYRIREGNYRIVYGIDAAAIVVLVIRIGHRREVYRKLD